MNAQPRAHPRPTPVLRDLGRVDYQTTWQRMQQFTDTRTALSADELWFLEHPPVFTLGMAGRREHLLAPGDIPVVPTDRGGQVTYHGPGQLVVYALIDLRRAGLGVRDLVTGLEQAVVRYAAQLGSITQGQGSYTMEFSHYDLVPGNVQQQIVSKSKVAVDEEE